MGKPKHAQGYGERIEKIPSYSHLSVSSIGLMKQYSEVQIGLLAFIFPILASLIVNLPNYYICGNLYYLTSERNAKRSSKRKSWSV